MSDSNPISYDVAEGVARLTFNRPEAFNALSMETLVLLGEHVDQIINDRRVRALLITGAGRAFCAGGDVKQMLADRDAAGGRYPPHVAMRGAAGLHTAIAGLARMPKPVICAVNGVAAGAGVGLALAGDIVWAAESATFSLAYTGIGLSPDGGTTHALPRAVGPMMATELLLTNRRVDAQEALRIGLVSRVCADQELITESEKLAAQLAQGPTRAYAEAKALVRQSLRNGLETQMELERQGIGRSAMSDDFAEGIAAFVDKRKPVFQGS